MSAIKIDPEFKALIPPLTADEYEQLESNLKAEGCRDPIVVWAGVILDGHNRFEICTRNGIGFEKITKQFSDRSEAIEWIIRNQFGRRNLSAFQRTKLALRLEQSIKERAKAHQSLSEGRGQKGKQNSADLIQPIETREEIAKLAGVSRDTVDKVKQIEKMATPEIKEALAKNEISINKAHLTVKTPRAADIEPDDEPPVVDGTTPKRERVPKWIPDDAERLWLLAKTDLDKILPSDASREKVLKQVVAYAQNRIQKNI